MNVLAIEDNDAEATLLKRMFGDHDTGIHLRVVDNADVVAFHRTWADIILADMNLPGSSGLDTIAHIRSLLDGRNIPIIAFSGMAYDDLAVIGQGADDFINKDRMMLANDRKGVLLQILKRHYVRKVTEEVNRLAEAMGVGA